MLDAERIEELRRVARGLAPGFVERMVARFEELSQAVTSAACNPTTTREALSELTHSMCGAASMIGARDVARIALSLEQACREGTDEQVRSLLSELSGCMQGTKRALRDALLGEPA
jgi:HPt (histidine-containing phosphotransfer) domain-containing protein